MCLSDSFLKEIDQNKAWLSSFACNFQCNLPVLLNSEVLWLYIKESFMGGGDHLYNRKYQAAYVPWHVYLHATINKKHMIETKKKIIFVTD